MLVSLFLLFLKVGFLCFGGGYPIMLFILHEGQAMVGLTIQEFADMTALELLASGPIALNAATYVGFIKAGIPGAVISTLGICLPSFVLTTILYAFLSRFKENKYVQGFILAIKLACGGILITAALTLSQTILLHSNSMPTTISAFISGVQWGGILIVLICMVAVKKFKVNPIIMIVVSAVLGVFLIVPA